MTKLCKIGSNGVANQYIATVNKDYGNMPLLHGFHTRKTHLITPTNAHILEVLLSSILLNAVSVSRLVKQKNAKKSSILWVLHFQENTHTHSHHIFFCRAVPLFFFQTHTHPIYPPFSKLFAPSLHQPQLSCSTHVRR